jgi:tRNA (guanine37-N1)-methyltransferase
MVPDVLRGGDHGAVERWRRAQSLIRTIERRPDLIARRGGLSGADVELLAQHGYPLGAAEPDRAGSPTTAGRGDAAAEERDQL